MSNVYIVADNVFSPNGITTSENFSSIKKGISGIKQHQNIALSPTSFYASLFNENTNYFAQNGQDSFTKFEQILVASITNALANSDINIADEKTALIISSTKGNIALLETEAYNADLQEKISLNSSAKKITAHFKIITQPIIISNACISGMLAILTGMRLIQSGQYNNVVVAGADIISKFILSGFQSFNAVSNTFCKPFDAVRNGINLGEAAGTIILSNNEKYCNNIKIAGGSISNDANHISGPSRTGEELHIAIAKTMKQANVLASDIGFISAHGTATIFNDEMEAKAITLANLQHVPTNSLKGYFGHTLGAAGIIESIISVNALRENIILPTLGFENIGVTMPISICNEIKETNKSHFLKTASGFGGCNAALIFSK
ncbi:MAG: beta-ketoacyl synthase N-terminal-like domain-containing protein [Ferruginibacter sp.]|nr:beta-ketoacyl synthase [Ferruginibacter sp.]